MLKKLALTALILTAATSMGTDAFAQDADQGEDDAPEQPNPRAPAGHGGGTPQMEVPQDTNVDVASLPNGVLEIMIVDPTNHPLPNTPVTLGIVFNTVAKGESRKHVQLTTNASGIARVEHLETGSAVAYRPTVAVGDATFAVTPFRMPEKGGERAVLHVYPIVEDIEKGMIVAQSVIYTEVKDDRVQIQQAYKIYNFGQNAWVPKDLVVKLPEEFTAFTSQQGMTDVGAESINGKGIHIHGTFGPGQHVIEFRWQLPYNGEPEVHFDVEMPPHMAAARIIAPASRDMTLEVPGFPPPKSSTDGQGQRALTTEKQVTKQDQVLKDIQVIIRGLPTEGPGKIVATLLSGLGLAFGLVIGARKPSKADHKTERARLLEEIEDLERARLAGDVGPKTYERARRELLDSLARTFTGEQPVATGVTAATPKKKKTAA